MLITAITLVVLGVIEVDGLHLEPPKDITMETYTFNFDQPSVERAPLSWSSFQDRIGVADGSSYTGPVHQVNRRHFTPVFNSPDVQTPQEPSKLVQKNVFMYSAPTSAPYTVPNYYLPNQKYNLLYIKSPSSLVPKVFIPEKGHDPAANRNIVVMFQNNPLNSNPHLFNNVPNSFVPPYVQPIVPSYNSFIPKPIPLGLTPSRFQNFGNPVETEPVFMSNALSHKHLKIDPNFDNDITQDNWKWNSRPQSHSVGNIKKPIPQDEKKIKMNIFTYGLPDDIMQHIMKVSQNLNKPSGLKDTDTSKTFSKFIPSTHNIEFPRAPLHAAPPVKIIPTTPPIPTEFSLCKVLGLCEPPYVSNNEWSHVNSTLTNQILSPRRPEFSSTPFPGTTPSPSTTISSTSHSSSIPIPSSNEVSSPAAVDSTARTTTESSHASFREGSFSSNVTPLGDSSTQAIRSTGNERATETRREEEDKTTPKSDELLTKATPESNEPVTKATLKSEELITKATSKSDELVTKATSMSDELVTKATSESNKPVTMAASKPDELVTKTTSNSNELVNNGTSNSNKLIAWATTGLPPITTKIIDSTADFAESSSNTVYSNSDLEKTITTQTSTEQASVERQTTLKLFITEQDLLDFQTHLEKSTESISSVQDIVTARNRNNSTESLLSNNTTTVTTS